MKEFSITLIKYSYRWIFKEYLDISLDLLRIEKDHWSSSLLWVYIKTEPERYLRIRVIALFGLINFYRRCFGPKAI